MTLERKIRYYKACKYEVANYKADHGYTLVELWKIVMNKVDDADLTAFWRNEVLDDYFYGR